MYTIIKTQTEKNLTSSCRDDVTVNDNVTSGS